MYRYECTNVGGQSKKSKRNTQVKYKYLKSLLKYSNKAFVLGGGGGGGTHLRDEGAEGFGVEADG